MKSIHAFTVVVLVWIGLGVFFYPKYKKPYTEAAISWDVSGYYHYLPGIFIYNDLRRQEWMSHINDLYLPSTAYDQAFVHPPSGHKVNKYTIGQAILYLPFFLTAHVYAHLGSRYPADGYSLPYQVCIFLGGLLISVLGLWWLRRILLRYFKDPVVLWIILTLGLTTNWVEYASISNGMSHTWLFTLLCGIILCSIRFYEKADGLSAAGIGLLLGLSVLTRPTELIWVCIPLLWGIHDIRDRMAFLWKERKWILFAAVICGAIACIQPLYWKYATGEWLVYSYGDQHMAWFHPKIWRGLFGTNLGWFLYTPVMLLAMAGWWRLYKQIPGVFWATGVTMFLAIYLTLSWPYFETGGGLGQRNLIQAYPLMAFPLGMILQRIGLSKYGRMGWYALFALFLYYNSWWIYQAHRGGFFQAGQMNTPYFFHVVGKLHPNPDFIKLLDTREYFSGVPKHEQFIWEESFQSDTSSRTIEVAPGERAAQLQGERNVLGPMTIPIEADCGQWIRCEGDFILHTRVWEYWNFIRWIIQFKQGDTVIKENLVRLERILPDDHVPHHLFFDVRLPEKPFTSCEMQFQLGQPVQSVVIDNLRVSCFREK